MASLRLGDINLSWIASEEGFVHAARRQLWEKALKAVSDSITSELGDESGTAAMNTAKALGSLRAAKQYSVQGLSDEKNTSKRQLAVKLHKQLYEVCFQNYVLSKLSTTVAHLITRVEFPAHKGALTKKYMDTISKGLNSLNTLFEPLYKAAR